MRIMKWGHIRISLLIAFTCCMPVMARHAHHRRIHGEKNCYRCPPGLGVAHRCNRHRDTECHPCEAGYFSGHHSAHRPCYPCSRCGEGLYIAHECTPTRDTVCDSCHTFKGPHNEDFYDKCVVPLSGTASYYLADTHQSNSTETDEQPSLDLKSTGVSMPVIVLSAVAVSAAVVIVIVTCLVYSSKRRHKKGVASYPYHVVATQEVVVL